MDPIQFEFRLADFDVDLLPAGDAAAGSETALRSRVRQRVESLFADLPGCVRTTFYDEYVSVHWVPVTASDEEALRDMAVSLLERRAPTEAEPILKALIARNPDDPVLLYNYGMMLSDAGRLDDAYEKLSHLTRVAPEHANAWTALGVLLSRQGRDAEAITSLEKAVALDGENGYARRNLGALIARKTPERALPHLKRAAELLPDDQQAQYGYGLCLFQTGHPDEADEVLSGALGLNEYSEVAELCRECRTRIAHATMRDRAGGGPRMDVVMYCLAALEKFETLSPDEVRKISFEIGLVGRSGLDINDPARKYRLRSMPGDFSGLQLAAYMYVGLKRTAPELDAGIDFSEEYTTALRLLADAREDLADH